MEGQNILYGNIDELDNIKALIEARQKTRDDIVYRESEKSRLEKDVQAEEKQLAEQIESTVSERRAQVVQSMDKEIGKARDRLKSAKDEKGKEKNKKVQERIKEETADLVLANENIKEEIRTIFGNGGVPGFMNNSFVFSLYYPKTLLQRIVMLLTYAIGLFVLPPFLAWIWGVKGILRVLLIILLCVLFLGLMIIGYNYIRVRHGDTYKEALKKRAEIRKNKGKINRKKKSIKRDKDEEQYGLHDYDEKIKEHEDELDSVVQRKKDAIDDFDNTTKVDIIEEITGRDMPKIDKLKQDIAELSIELKELVEREKEMSINLSTNYSAYIGEENMTAERIDMLIGYIKEGQASNIGEAVNISKKISKK